MDLAPGQQVERYQVVHELGRGGTAVVYLVRHLGLDTLHALKVLLLHSASIRKRMLQEGKVQARLGQHRNIVAVRDVIDVHGSPGLLLDFVHGPALDRFLKARRLTVDQADLVARGILAAVASAHELGMIHRDLKPGNVMLDISEGEIVPKVTDFGLAKVFGEAKGDFDHAMTRTGVPIGTPAYMAPEQIRNAKGAGKRADVYSIGVILYELLSGERAYRGSDTIDLFNQVTSGDCEPIESLVPSAPDHMLEAVRQAMAVDPEERIGSCAELLELWVGDRGALIQGAESWDDDTVERARGLGSMPDADVLESLSASSPGGTQNTLTWTDSGEAAGGVEESSGGALGSNTYATEGSAQILGPHSLVPPSSQGSASQRRADPTLIPPAMVSEPSVTTPASSSSSLVPGIAIAGAIGAALAGVALIATAIGLFTLRQTGPVEVTGDPAALCTAAYNAEATRTHQAVVVPAAAKDAYLERCQALGLPPAELACLDLSRAEADPEGCGVVDVQRRELAMLLQSGVRAAAMDEQCRRAYRSERVWTEAAFEQSEQELPELPTEDAYAERCVALGFTDGELTCLDRTKAGSGCAELEASMAARVDKLPRFPEPEVAVAPEPTPRPRNPVARTAEVELEHDAISARLVQDGEDIQPGAVPEGTITVLAEYPDWGQVDRTFRAVGGKRYFVRCSGMAGECTVKEQP